MLQDGLLVLVAPNFQTTGSRRNVRRTECLSSVFLRICEKKDGMYLLHKFINEVQWRAAIECFLRSLTQNKP